MKLFLYCSLIVGAPLLLMCCASTPDTPNEIPTGRLPPCPSSPNCVSTDATEPAQQMAPLPYRVDRATSCKVILSIVRAMPRTAIVTEADHYLHAEFRSGYSDMGVNRQRMTAIGEAYRAKNTDDVSE